MSLWSRAKSTWRLLGPGFVTGSSDDDPSGIATYSQTGAQFGYSQLWLALRMLPFMVAIQDRLHPAVVFVEHAIFFQQIDPDS
jgi:Mn2+/Fe2+ NRAMP family transporter